MHNNIAWHSPFTGMKRKLVGVENRNLLLRAEFNKLGHRSHGVKCCSDFYLLIVRSYHERTSTHVRLKSEAAQMEIRLGLWEGMRCFNKS